MAEDELCQDAARGGTCDDGTDGRLDPAPSIPFSDHDVDNHDQYRAGQYIYPPFKECSSVSGGEDCCVYQRLLDAGFSRKGKSCPCSCFVHDSQRAKL
jgi:hypothetical protein